MFPSSLRIAIVLNPFTLRRKGGDHAPTIARELLGRGHAVRAFGDLGGGVPQSKVDFDGDGVTAPLEGTSLSAFSPNLIVAYDALSPAAFRAARAARKLGVPLVIVEEGFPDHGKQFERMLRGFGAWAFGGTVRRATKRIVALDPVAVAQADKEGFDPAIVTELGSGVDIQRFRPGLASERLVRHGIPGHMLLVIGRVEPGRGIDVLVDAFARTVGQGAGWNLVFAGEGSLRQRLRAQCERLGVSSRVRWIGPPSKEELPGLLGSSTALLVPALDDDVASQKIIRAMACGIPVLASDVGRLRGKIEHEVNGLVVPPGDRNAWAEAISRLASDPNRRARWGRAAREKVELELSWQRVADSFEEILLAVTAQSESSSRRLIPDGDESHPDAAIPLPGESRQADLATLEP